MTELVPPTEQNKQGQQPAQQEAAAEVATHGADIATAPEVSKRPLLYPDGSGVPGDNFAGIAGSPTEWAADPFHRNDGGGSHTKEASRPNG